MTPHLLMHEGSGHQEGSQHTRKTRTAQLTVLVVYAPAAASRVEGREIRQAARAGRVEGCDVER